MGRQTVFPMWFRLLQPCQPFAVLVGLLAFWPPLAGLVLTSLRTRRTLAAGLLLPALMACNDPNELPNEVVQLVDQSLVHLEAAERGLREADGDWKRLAEFSMHYRMEHSAEYVQLRQKGEALTASLTPLQRQKLAHLAQQKAAPTLAKTEQAAQRFADPQRALQMVRPLVVAGTPQSTRKGPPAILPPLPPHPAEQQLPSGATPTSPTPTTPAPAATPGK